MTSVTGALMIVENKPSWISLLLRWRGSVLPRIWLRVLVTAVFAALVTAANEIFNPEHETILTLVPFSLVGLALSIFLGFRNNTSYDRFWEGRKLWGRYVNTSRSFARQLLTLSTAGAEDAEALAAWRREAVHHLIAYIHAARLHLRDQDRLDELAPLIDANALARLQVARNRPLVLLQRLGERVQEAARRGWIDRFHVPVLEASLTDLTDIQGGCERIKSTPIPFSYTVLIHRIVAVYCMTLPLGIVQDAGLLTPLVVLMVSYAFFGLDAIGDEIEEPFGEDINDLPLSAISRAIEINLRQTLGEAELPPPLAPVRGVLS